ncbi:glycosyltransferase family protein [Methylomonas sp. 2BW1-5-20]|uniref:glycosyltransferase family protein n=1 Tax=Methylomonas sp. 2BW1-5-20 TaxID=3376686 RepID=UPI004052338C
MQDLKILYGYSWFVSSAYGNVQALNQAYINKLAKIGFNVEGFCLTLNPPGPCLSFSELDARWRRGDRELLNMYERLERALEGKNVLINSSGINLHPEFVAKLPVFTVFQCFDDPESSAELSKPTASSYDLCLVGNIAEVDTYRSWGVKHAEWVPMGLQPTIYDASISYDDVLNGNRELDLFMMIDRTAPARKPRLDKLALAFPNANFYGKGWPRGYLPNNKELEYLRNAKIGPNLHNSSGPINYRTFYLPANGVLQVCDNKNYLGKIYELNKEVIGFDSIRECIDLCRYYLAHDEERRIIAANGWQRATSDYNEFAVFERNIQIIKNLISPKICNKKNTQIAVSHAKTTNLRRHLYDLWSFKEIGPRTIKRLVPSYRLLKTTWHNIYNNFIYHNHNLNLPHGLIEELVSKYSAQSWFIYAAKERHSRWHIRCPSEWIVRHIPKHSLIFETGAGCGLNLVWLAQQGFTNLYGSDVSAQSIEVGRELSARLSLTIDLWQDDGLKPTTLPSNVDILLALNWTYHIEDFSLLDFLKLYRNYLVSGGFFIIDIVDKSYDLIKDNQYLTSDWNKPENERRPSEYKTRYSENEVKDACLSSGYIITAIIEKPSKIPRVVYILNRLQLQT